MSEGLKNKLFILVSLLLVCVIACEVTILFRHSSDSEYEEKETDGIKVLDIDRSKYIVDIYTSYHNDNLERVIEVEGDNLYYYVIDGLLDSKIQDKVNESIRNKVQKLVGAYPDKAIGGEIVSNFENTLSIRFLALDKRYCNSEDFKKGRCDGTTVGTLNFDLSTGDEIALEDVVMNSKSAIREVLLRNLNEDAFKKIGIVCGCGPCENPNPDYSLVEDSVLSVMNKFNSDNFMFTFDAVGIHLYFNKVYMHNFKAIDLDAFDPDAVYGLDCSNHGLIAGTYKICYFYETDYSVEINFKDIYKNVVIYDRFKTSSSLYEVPSTEVGKKFTKPLTDEDLAVSLDMRLEEKETQLLDYFVDVWPVEEKVGNFAKRLYADVTAEAIRPKANDFNIFNLSGKEVGAFIFDEKYVYYKFDVFHYLLKKGKYLEYKERIYISNYDRYSTNEGDIIIQKGYEFLKDNLNKKSFYYYIYDLKGNPVKTKDVFSINFDFTTIVPPEWLASSNYGSMDAMLDDALLIIDEEDFENKNHLVFHVDTYSRKNEYLSIKYKGQKIVIANNFDDYRDLIKKIFK